MPALLVGPDRIACINPDCRRTAPGARYPGSDWIICRTCWNSMPERFRRDHKALKRRNKTLSRLSRKHQFSEGRGTQWDRIADLYDRAGDRWLTAVVTYFTDPPAPAGIENFLKEMGFDAKI